jgi:hypothetical protein
VINNPIRYIDPTGHYPGDPDGPYAVPLQPGNGLRPLTRAQEAELGGTYIHEVKGELGGGSKYDLYVDDDGNVWHCRKGTRNCAYVGEYDAMKEEARKIQEAEARERENRNRAREKRGESPRGRGRQRPPDGGGGRRGGGGGSRGGGSDCLGMDDCMD